MVQTIELEHIRKHTSVCDEIQHLLIFGFLDHHKCVGQEFPNDCTASCAAKATTTNIKEL